jgi:hypothetical protein
MIAPVRIGIVAIRSPQTARLDDRSAAGRRFDADERTKVLCSASLSVDHP